MVMVERSGATAKLKFIKPEDKLVRNPYQTCAGMLSLLRTPTEQLKWSSKREKSMVKTVRKRMRGECPVAGAGAPGSRAPRTLFLTAFTIGFLRFEVYLSCSVGVLRRDSITAHVWYGLRTNFGNCRQLLPKKNPPISQSQDIT